LKVTDNPPKVVNLGVPGTQVDQYLERGIAKVTAAVKSGDIVVISITWNDLVGFFESPKWVTDHLWKVGLKQISNNFQRPKVTRIRKTLTKELNRSVSK